jgi:hypothetical protein
MVNAPRQSYSASEHCCGAGASGSSRSGRSGKAARASWWRIAQQLPAEEEQDEARRSSRWYGVGPGWGAAGGRDLLCVANEWVYGQGPVDWDEEEDGEEEVMGRLDRLLQG